MVSIITPVYDRVTLFEQTCKSVLAQTYSDFEWLIIDDGSNEDVKGLLDKFNDRRIIYFRLPHSGKLPKLRNYGIKNSNGELIIFLDSDDLWKPNALDAMVRVLERDNGLGFVVAETEIFRGERTEFSSIYRQEHKINAGKRFFLELFCEQDFVFFASSVLFRRSCLDRNGICDENLLYGDKDFFTRLAFHFKAMITTEVLIRIRKHDQNVTATLGVNSPAVESIREELYTINYFFMKNFIDAALHKKLSGFYNFKLAEYYYEAKSFKDAKKMYAKCLKYDSMNMKARIKKIISRVKG